MCGTALIYKLLRKPLWVAYVQGKLKNIFLKYYKQRKISTQAVIEPATAVLKVDHLLHFTAVLLTQPCEI